MDRPVIYDATTLRNFAVVDRLDICKEYSGVSQLPRWTEEVCNEITQGAASLDIACGRVCLAAWLGPPVCPEEDDLERIVELQIALSDPSDSLGRNAGEAESIFFAEVLGVAFATDDNWAFQFAASRQTLGPTRVIDTVGILTAAVKANAMSAAEAARVCTDIRSAGRHLRRRHPTPIRPDYFDVKAP